MFRKNCRLTSILNKSNGYGDIIWSKTALWNTYYLSITAEEKFFPVSGKSVFVSGAAPENVAGRNDRLETWFLVSRSGKELFTLTY